MKTTMMTPDWLNVHFIYATIVRLILLVYAEIHDRTGFIAVKYTDLDYDVFSDAAGYVTEGKSPYLRPTYRYTPILAWLLTLNVYVHPVCGKLLFVFGDILGGWLIHRLLLTYEIPDKKKRFSVLCWLYNPLTIVISTRGSAESVVTCLVLCTMLLLQKKCSIWAGVIYGVAIHFKLYPLTYCLPLYFSQVTGEKKSKNSRRGLWKNLMYFFYPNSERVKFTATTVSSLMFLTSVFYLLYGNVFINEAYLYHLIRKDTKHNFSVYFYMLYLMSETDSLVLKMFAFLPQVILILMLSFKYHRRDDLPFCLFAQTFVFVTLNKVVTSQYFIWYISLLPLVIPRLRLSIKRGIALLMIWLGTQAVWLLFAFLLEFKGFNTFLYIWIASILFFIANVKILSEMIKSYN